MQIIRSGYAFAWVTGSLCALLVLSHASARADHVLHSFEPVVLSERFFAEGACVADLNGDGHQDIVAGPFWYAGPSFTDQHAYTTAGPFSITSYSQHFFTFPHDFNGDGAIDLLVIGMPGTPAQWFENPASEETTQWKKHLVLADVGNESPLLADLVEGAGPELICVHQGDFGYATPDDDPTAPWQFHPISSGRRLNRFTHGMGIGDVDGDGRPDLLETEGWWRQTNDARFVFHPVRFAESGGAQMFVSDFDGDGDNDVVSVQNAHGFGLKWFERRGVDEDFVFVPHSILAEQPEENAWGLRISQMHALGLADMDGDGIDDLVTGKRYFAHGGKDPASHELPVLYWFRTRRTSSGVVFEPHLISERGGVGTQLAIEDVTGNGEPDIVVSNKLGTFFFRHQTASVDEAALTAASPQRQSSPRHVAGTRLFTENVRSTDPLTAEEESATFTLPPGFEIELVAAEPQIDKPMNLAFDRRGRLWVSSSREYPFPAEEPAKARDSIRILEDTNGDGRADKVTTFADGLNIPMGLYPYRDGVICFTIPDILFLRDVDGDDRADERIKLVGPFDTSRDTHGMCNGFTRGLDGWLYICHGFNNQSKVSGSDGHEVEMHSGNTFRMRVDGSRVEHYTHGQVNPFGLTFDRFGDLFSADCHTKPITLLLKNGSYQSFGRPHDGLGFVPDVMEHLHGSTGIAGIAEGAATNFPDVYRTSFFGGNVVTGRINRNSIVREGATVRAVEEPDFLIPSDPWFRPVDLQVGPDGALYIADFYNRIIGHYEVDLKHPGRDRERGRIWRIVYSRPEQRRDEAGGTETEGPMPDLSTQEIPQLIELLDTNLQTRAQLIVDELASRESELIVSEARRALQHPSINVRLHVLWLLHRLDQLQLEAVADAAADRSPRLRVHAMRVIGAGVEARSLDAGWMQHAADDRLVELLVTGMDDDEPMVRRAAVEAAGEVKHVKLSLKIIDLFHRSSETDSHLRHAVKLSLRNQLRDEAIFAEVASRVARHDVPLLAAVSLGLNSTTAGQFVVDGLPQLAEEQPELLENYLTFAVTHAPGDAARTVADIAQKRFHDDVAFQLQLLDAIRLAIDRRGNAYPVAIEDWASELAIELLGIPDLKADDENIEQLVGRQDLPWEYVPIPGVPAGANPWGTTRRRNAADGAQNVMLHSSFPGGEKETGVYRSAPFPVDATFHFYLAGHDGFPDKPLGGKNLVRMRDASTHAILHRTPPPRNDVAQLIEWDTREIEGREVYLELVDADTGGAFAWLVAGRFSEPRLNPSDRRERLQRAIELYQQFSLDRFDPLFRAVASSGQLQPGSQSELLQAIAGQRSRAVFVAAAKAVAVVGTNDEGIQQATEAILKKEEEQAKDVVKKALMLAGPADQQEIARTLTQDQRGGDFLLDLVDRGTASARLLTIAAIQQQLETLLAPSEREKMNNLVEALPNEDLRLRQLVSSRTHAYVDSPGSREEGIRLFKEHCSNCHQIAGRGKEVGPNLDGIGNRGLERIAEDVLLPNRNVDKAFRSTIVVTDDGRVMSGLAKPAGDKTLTLIDNTGKEVTLPTTVIEQQTTATLSPMPGNFGDVLNEKQFNDLLAYLLSVK